MARSYGRILVKIWDDPDWLALTASQQVTYLALISSRDLSFCGVHPLLPQRLAGSSVDLTHKKVLANLDALQQQPGRFLVIDHDTAEILVRSLIRHDEIMKQPNVRKAMVTALEKVRSPTLKDVIIGELRRSMHEQPKFAGWKTFDEDHPCLFAELVATPLRKVS